MADIAKRAGLTERTFFRHHADKREVLFGGSAALQDELLRALDGVPPALPSIEAVRIAVAAASTLMHGRRAFPVSASGSSPRTRSSRNAN